MHYDLTKKYTSSFLSCEKDLELIIKKLFMSNTNLSEQLKRLLVINEKDCLDNYDSEVYKKVLDEMTLSKMVEKGYIRFCPKLEFDEHEEVKSYIIISFDDFVPSENPQFRDNIIRIDAISHTDHWDLGDFRIRPVKIVGCIDGLLNKTKMTGIGILLFNSCSRLILDKNISGYTIVFDAVHGSDDVIEND